MVELVAYWRWIGTCLSFLLEKAKEYSKPKKPTEEEQPDLDELVEKTIDLDQGAEDDESDQTSPTKALFQNAVDILDAEENKDQILQLLRKAEVNLSAIDYQSADLKKPAVVKTKTMNKNNILFISAKLYLKLELL